MPRKSKWYSELVAASGDSPVSVGSVPFRENEGHWLSSCDEAAPTAEEHLRLYKEAGDDLRRLAQVHSLSRPYLGRTSRQRQVGCWPE